MTDTTLQNGTRRYSSWSLRGWLAVRAAGLDAKDHGVPLAQGTTAALADLTPSGLVACLRDQGITVWNNLAVIGYCSEIQPLWSEPAAARAHAPPLTKSSQAYCTAIRRHPLVAEWYDLAAAEPSSWRIEPCEATA